MTRLRSWKVPLDDLSLSALLCAQVLVTFIAIPLAASYPGGRVLMDLGHLLLAAICAVALTHRRSLRLILLAGLFLLAAGPPLFDHLGARFGFGAEMPHEIISAVAFAFNLLVTLLVAFRAFGPGRVNAHRVEGAVLIYLNTAALFSIAYGAIETHAPGSIRTAANTSLGTGPGVRTADLSYFSLSTITTAGYGDIIPVSRMARSLANLEAVFGQIFPATFVARLIALHLVHSSEKRRDDL